MFVPISSLQCIDPLKASSAFVNDLPHIPPIVMDQIEDFSIVCLCAFNIGFIDFLGLSLAIFDLDFCPSNRVLRLFIAVRILPLISKKKTKNPQTGLLSQRTHGQTKRKH